MFTQEKTGSETKERRDGKSREWDRELRKKKGTEQITKREGKWKRKKKKLEKKEKL